MQGENGLKEEGDGSSLFQDDLEKNGGKVELSPVYPADKPLIDNITTESVSEDELHEDSMDSRSKGNLISQQFAFIDDQGTCSSCGDASASQCSLICLFCKSLFHAVCKDAMKGDKKGNDVICTRSFYNTFSNINHKRPHNFLFACDACMTQEEHVEVATSESKVDLIDKRVNNLSKSMEEMKDLLSKVVTMQVPPPSSSDNTPKPGDKPLFSEMLKQPAPLKRSVLIVQSQNPSTKKEDTDKVDRIIQENSIHIDKKYENRKGEIVYVCPTENDRKILDLKISNDLPQVTRHQPPERHPTISVANICQQYQENELQEIILQAHPTIKSLVNHGETFSVLKIKKQLRNESKYQATIRVSNSIRKIIEGQGNRLYICSYSCKVFDHFHVKRCNNCQCYGHYKADCKASQPSCGYCAKNHHSENCPEKTNSAFLPCCSNCTNGKFDGEKHTHTSFDRTCPSYVAEQNQLRKTISYYNQKNS